MLVHDLVWGRSKTCSTTWPTASLIFLYISYFLRNTQAEKCLVVAAAISIIITN
jgi:hypothetical protein